MIKTRQLQLEVLLFMKPVRTYRNIWFPLELRPKQLQEVKTFCYFFPVVILQPVYYFSMVHKLVKVYTAASIKREQHQTVSVVCRLQSIYIDEHIAETW